MTEFRQTYKLQDDKEAIKRLQVVSDDKNSNFGLKTENGLLVGSYEWFNAIDTARIEKQTINGEISKVFMSGHNDYPEFEMDSNGVKTNWTREGKDEHYKVGKKIELTYVTQKFKRPIDILGMTTKLIIEIRIEK
jgi:hypothetical protein